MKLKLVRFSIAYALVVAAILFFVGGCANQTIKQDSLRSANAVDSRAKIKSFEARLSFAQIGPITDMAHNIMGIITICLLYTSPSPRDRQKSRMPSSA